MFSNLIQLSLYLPSIFTLTILPTSSSPLSLPLLLSRANSLPSHPQPPPILLLHKRLPPNRRPNPRTPTLPDKKHLYRRRSLRVCNRCLYVFPSSFQCLLSLVLGLYLDQTPFYSDQHSSDFHLTLQYARLLHLLRRQTRRLLRCRCAGTGTAERRAGRCTGPESACAACEYDKERGRAVSGR